MTPGGMGFDVAAFRLVELAVQVWIDERVEV
jgi:hypothetical protein